jgi:single-strand DNA-binding protein
VNETVLTVVGNVAQDPRLRVTSTGTRVVTFRLASTERRYDKALRSWRDGDTIFYTVTCWRNVGENALESLEKGDPVVVHGRLRENRYEKEGQSHSVLEIQAYSLGHDISRGVSKFTRASRSAEHRDVLVDEDAEDIADVHTTGGAAGGPAGDDGIVQEPSPSAA